VIRSAKKDVSYPAFFNGLEHCLKLHYAQNRQLVRGSDMGTELRRFPRIPYDDEGRLELRGAEPFPVTIRTVSCQGAGVDVHMRVAQRIKPGAEIRLLLQVDDRDIELPGRVVWAAGSHVGIRLRLGLASSATRQAYASWIVPLTNKLIARANQAPP
jgi:hypothetical protein